jgi:predicted RNA binding protein YcfA (HicA-like mRNA interferase family)
MPRKVDKLWQKAKRTKAGWSAKDLISLYEGFGFQVRQAKGSHVIVSHPENKELRATVAIHAKELDKGYVDQAIDLIEKLLELQSLVEKPDELSEDSEDKSDEPDKS